MQYVEEARAGLHGESAQRLVETLFDDTTGTRRKSREVKHGLETRRFFPTREAAEEAARSAAQELALLDEMNEGPASYNPLYPVIEGISRMEAKAKQRAAAHDLTEDTRDRGWFRLSLGGAPLAYVGERIDRKVFQSDSSGAGLR